MDTEGIEDSEGYYDEGYEDLEEAYGDGFEDGHDEGYDEGLSDGEGSTGDMTEEEAFDTFELATALGLGEEIGLGEADHMRAIRELDSPTKKKSKDPISIKEAKGKIFNAENKLEVSTLTGKPKCPFEQWIKDVCAGRKSVHDPIGGENSYESEY